MCLVFILTMINKILADVSSDEAETKETNLVENLRCSIIVKLIPPEWLWRTKQSAPLALSANRI